MTCEEAKALFEKELTTIENTIRCISFRRGVKDDERDDLYSWIMWKLIERNYRRIRLYRGRSRFRSYITTVIGRLYVDFRTHYFGKWHPSSTARALGDICEELERLLYKERRSFDEAAQVLASRRANCPPRATLWMWHEQLPQRQTIGFKELTDVDVASAWNPEDVRERETDQARLASDLTKAIAALDVQERVIVQRSFQRGSSAREIGDVMHLGPKQVYGKRARAIKTLRSRLETMGWTSADVASLLGGRGDDLVCHKA